MGILDRVRRFLANDAASARASTFGDLDAAAIPDQQGARASSPAVPETDIEITPEFELARELVEAKTPFLFVTGRAGTGKTTFVRWIVERVAQTAVVVAPTGLAALTAGGQTIHSFFRFPFGVLDRSVVQEGHGRAIYKHLRLLIIDEISMVRVDILEAIDAFLTRHGPEPGKPFGGVPILAVGDLYQLPPVVSSASDAQRYLSDNYSSPYFFSAPCLREIEPLAVQLTRPFRQEDASFLDLLNRIREGRDLEATVDALNAACCEPELDDPEWLMLVPTRARAGQINAARLAELPGELRRFVGKIEGRFLSGKKGVEDLREDELEKLLPSPYRLELKPGAAVVFTQNDPGKRWVNGTRGRVERIDDKTVSVAITDRDAAIPLVEVAAATWERYRYNYDRSANRIEREVIGSYRQLPLAPAWAMTIHKAQGQTLERVLVDLDWGTFASGQAYVALSRCRSIEGLRFRRPLRPGDIKCDESIVRLYARLRDIEVNAMLDPDE